MKKYRFVEKQNGHVVIEKRVCFFFWINAYENLLGSPTFYSLADAKDRLERDLKHKQLEKVKQIHYD